VSTTSSTSEVRTARTIASELKSRCMSEARHLFFTAIGARLGSNRSAINRALIITALLAYGLMVNPETGHGGIPCLWKTLFGFECPGCGLSRAGALLLRGRVQEAARANWLIFPFVWASVCKAATLYFPSVVNSWRIQRWQN
jgi:hypothetical protein